jgi:O-antigen/teichoic acid export membrane protein
LNLKQKTVSGLAWSFTSNFLGQTISFVIGIILARLLTPREYGLVGMVIIFTYLANPFVNSGFSQAIIRKKNCTQTDFSTVFYFNMFVAFIFYILLYFSAPYISKFFNEPELTRISRIIGIVVITDAASIIQTTLLTKDLDFRLQSKVTLIATIIPGALSIILAFKGFGVWSLVYRTLLNSFLFSAILWLKNKWKPEWIFKISVLKEMFGFSSKLLASGILDQLYYNIYGLVIGKFFAAKELGYYTRAKMFKDLGSEVISETISKVTYPVLSSIQDEPKRLKANYISILLSTMFIVFGIMFFLTAISETLILALIGDQWRGSVVYLQLLSIVGIFFPLHSITKNILYVYGKSTLYFNLQLFTKALAVPVIIIGVFYGLTFMIYAMILSGFIEFIIKAYYSGKLIDYPVMNLLKDLLPSFLLTLTAGMILVIIKSFVALTPLPMFLILSIVWIITLTGMAEAFKLKEYLFVKEIIIDKVKSIQGRNKYRD